MNANKFSIDEIGFNQEIYKELNWTGGFEEYVEIVKKNPLVSASAFKRLYEAIMEYGTEEYVDFKKRITKYKAFTNPTIANSLKDIGVAEDDTVFGLDLPIMRIMSILESAAKEYGLHKMLFLLVGPVGSAKSTIVRRMKKILERFTTTDKGAIYTFEWIAVDNREMQKIIGAETAACPIHEEPLNLVPRESQAKLLGYLGPKVSIRAGLCPYCRIIQREGLKICKGNWVDMIKNHLRIKRFVFSESDRIGIGTFQPKDEKNQDSTELTGDINYRALSRYGVDSDPRAFSFDGEFFIANRGLVEFIEIFKLDKAFLYDLLTGSQEHKVKPKKFQQVDIDEVIIGHTNEPEYEKLKADEFMEAIKDRTVQTVIPYTIKLKHEEDIYKKTFGISKLKEMEKHMAPHTLEIAAMWAVITRLVEPKQAQLTLLQKLKLYDGKSLPGFTEDNVKDLLKEGKSLKEGEKGISVRYIIQKISSALVDPEAGNCINPFKVLTQLKSGLPYHALIISEDDRKRYDDLIKKVEEELETILKDEVRRAISSDKKSLETLCKNYIDNIKAYTQKEKVKNKYTGKIEEPDERLMRSIEEKIEIPETRKDDFRREIMNYLGALSVDGKIFRYDSNERLLKALELKLFEDQKDTMQRFSTIFTSSSGELELLDKESREVFDVTKSKLIKEHGYCDVCATDVLAYVASIFARGDIKETAKK